MKPVGGEKQHLPGSERERLAVFEKELFCLCIAQLTVLSRVDAER
jgi:hypothetical protein